MIDITKVKNLKKGLYVEIEMDNGKRARGYIKEILTKNNNPNGIRVMVFSSLTNSPLEGIVVHVPSKNDVHKENFKYYNLFFSNKEFYSIVDCEGDFHIVKLNKNTSSKQAVLIFSKPDKAKEFLKTLKDDSLSLKRISTRNMIQSNFSKVHHDCYLIDGIKLVQRIKFEELEKYFSMHQ